MSILSRLFGGGGKPAAKDVPAETYEGFTIRPEPAHEGGRWRVGATIEKDGRTHRLIRADTLDTREAAETTSLRKAQQVIDEQGDALFD